MFTFNGNCCLNDIIFHSNDDLLGPNTTSAGQTIISTKYSEIYKNYLSVRPLPKKGTSNNVAVNNTEPFGDLIHDDATVKTALTNRLSSLREGSIKYASIYPLITSVFGEGEVNTDNMIERQDFSCINPFSLTKMPLVKLTIPITATSTFIIPSSALSYFTDNNTSNCQGILLYGTTSPWSSAGITPLEKEKQVNNHFYYGNIFINNENSISLTDSTKEIFTDIYTGQESVSYTLTLKNSSTTNNYYIYEMGIMGSIILKRTSSFYEPTTTTHQFGIYPFLIDRHNNIATDGTPNLLFSIPKGESTTIVYKIVKNIIE